MDYNELINSSIKAITVSENLHPMTDVVTLRDALDFADWYHKNELSELHQPTVISSVCNSPCCKEVGVFELPLGSEWYCKEHYKQNDL